MAAYRATGYTPREAAIQFFNITQGQVRKYSACLLIKHGYKLVKRMLGKADNLPAVYFMLVKSWIRHMLCQRGKVFLDSRKVQTKEELFDSNAIISVN